MKPIKSGETQSLDGPRRASTAHGTNLPSMPLDAPRLNALDGPQRSSTSRKLDFHKIIKHTQTI